LAVNRLWNVAGFGGGMAGLAVGLAVARRPSGAPAADVPKSVDVVLALVGYAALIVITFALVVVSPVREAMGRLVWQADFPETVTALGYRTPAEPGKAIVLLRHAGAALTYASAFSYVLYAATGRFRRGAAGRILISTGRGVLPSWIGIASMVSMVSIMTHAGMTDILARGLAAAAGPAFPVVAPWIGALGAFISGSNTSSNLLFGLLQRRTAELLGIAAAGVLAAQTAGGAIGSVVSPAKVAVGAASVGRQGSTVDEGAVLRSLLAPAAVLVALCSLIVVVLRWVGWG
jgi:lactate permease